MMYNSTNVATINFILVFNFLKIYKKSLLICFRYSYFPLWFLGNSYKQVFSNLPPKLICNFWMYHHHLVMMMITKQLLPLNPFSWPLSFICSPNYTPLGAMRSGQFLWTRLEEENNWEFHILVAIDSLGDVENVFFRKCLENVNFWR